ncbi:hypothetical protein ACVCNR_17470 (plasmid) [Aquamicrobium terrae]
MLVDRWLWLPSSRSHRVCGWVEQDFVVVHLVGLAHGKQRGTGEAQTGPLLFCIRVRSSEQMLEEIGTGVAAFQVRIAYITPHRRSLHYFHQLILAGTRQAALIEARNHLIRCSPDAHTGHKVANLRPDSLDAEIAIRAGWSLRDGWW